METSKVSEAKKLHKTKLSAQAKRLFLTALLSIILAGTSLFGGLSACSSKSETIVIGTMTTEDFLPMWVAEYEGYFAAEGIEVELVTFQSAQEMTTALAAGELDMAMTDIMVAANLFEAGTELSLEWVTMGENATQGRFGIMTSPNSGITRLEDLAGSPIGVGKNTILEYVMDNLMLEAGVAKDQILVEEIPKIPVRYEMMVNGEVAAAALPGSLLNLGEKTGMVLVADDTAGSNISQSVMVVNKDFLASDAGRKATDKVRACWDKAATAINDSLASGADSYRALLIEKASIPDPIAADYPISTYPMAKKPTQDMVEPVLSWMLEKGYLDTALSYDVDSASFSK